MDRMLAFIVIFLGIVITMAAILAMGAVPKIFQSAEISNETKLETQNQTALITKHFERENNKTNQSIQLLETILINQENARADRDKKNEEIMIILALLNHETRQLVKLNLDAHNITDYHDVDFLNKRHYEFPFYFTNKTHVIIQLDGNTNRTIQIPYEMSNLLMQFNNNGTLKTTSSSR